MIKIHPPDSKPYGLSYEDHIIYDWSRILPIPVNQNPMEDKTGAFCTNGCEVSKDPVVYLSGNCGGKDERTIKGIPSALGACISINQVVVTEAEAPGKPTKSLHDIAKADQDSTEHVFLKIDDQEYNLEELMKYRFHTKEFSVMLPPNALWGTHAGPSNAVADGFYVITEELPVGNHTIVTQAKVAKPFNQEAPWISEVKYNLEVI
jgi:hypothetical protein